MGSDASAVTYMYMCDVIIQETVSGGSSVEENPGCQSMPVNPEIECSMCIEEDEEEVDNENGNTETELCVEPVSCSEDEEREEREGNGNRDHITTEGMTRFVFCVAHVAVFGGTTYRLSVFEKCRCACIYAELGMYDRWCMYTLVLL